MSLKDELYEEVRLKNEVSVEGIRITKEVNEILKNADLGGKYQEEVHGMFEYDKEPHAGIPHPVGFKSPSGFLFPFNSYRKSRFSIGYDKGSFILTENGNKVFDIDFLERPEYYRHKTSSGVEMKNIAVYNHEGVVFVTYSNECHLKEKGLDCLYCNINATKDTYAEVEGIQWKYPKQIAETVSLAYKEPGRHHVTLTGGFIPEHREMDYYFDVAEAIQQETGLFDFNGTAVIGAPEDHSIIERYKEAGYRTLAINIELWDKNIFKSICPGKEQLSGGWENWKASLEHAAKVFGHGRVRSNIVAGIEPKRSTLEGVDYLASQGVICFAGAWCPNPGSELENHRSPEPEWHWDLLTKIYEIYRKNGFTYDQLYDCNASSNTCIHDFYRIEEGLLPILQKEKQLA